MIIRFFVYIKTVNYGLIQVCKSPEELMDKINPVYGPYQLWSNVSPYNKNKNYNCKDFKQKWWKFF